MFAIFVLCRTQRRSTGISDSIRSVTEKCREGYPWRLGNTGGILSSLQECQSEDWALQSWSTEHWRWPPQRSSTSSSVWRKRGRSGSSGDEWTSMSVRNLTAEVRIYLKDSSWLRVQDRDIFSERGLKHRATKERGFQEHARKIFPDLARGRHDESYIFLGRV